MKSKAIISTVVLAGTLTFGAAGVADAAPAAKPPCAKAPQRIENLEEKIARLEAKAAAQDAKAAEKESAGKTAAAKALRRAAEKLRNQAARHQTQIDKLAADCSL